MHGRQAWFRPIRLFGRIEKCVTPLVHGPQLADQIMPGLLLAASDKCGWQHHRGQVLLRRRSFLFRWGPRCRVTSAVWAFPSDNSRPSAVSSSTGGAHGHGALSEPTESIDPTVRARQLLARAHKTVAEGSGPGRYTLQVSAVGMRTTNLAAWLQLHMQ
jgi:hypothetical protein